MSRFPALVALCALFCASRTTFAVVKDYQAILDGPSESPPNASPGTGFTEVTIDTIANTMKVHVDFAGLLGPSTACHIHAPTADPFTLTAGVATTTPYFTGFPIGVTSGSYDNTLDLTAASSYNPAYVTANGGTPASAEAALLAAIDAGKSYLNIHTTVVPGGEIRGFLVPVPEPGCAAVIGVSAMLLGRRRQRAS
ncbi:MAG TPA: CHRD domain-containing protein [Tepidisphaeraceae bacterium]|jgi:hypothetical protein|nr:CHRD domain-containing protein [Tepidisphaeraceae bacterium]